MGGKGLTCTTRLLADPSSIDSCRNQAITTHESGLAGLGSGGVTANRMPPSDRKTHALKIPARRTEYSLTENVASPFQAEPRHANLDALCCGGEEFCIIG